ncbi:MAG: DUF4870 domain-containing protein [Microbacteriaceae bacterium]
MTDSNTHQPYEPPAGQPGQAAGPYPAETDKQMAMWSHFGGVLGWIPPLVLWLIGKDRGAYINQEGKESLNFQITMVIAWIALSIVNIVLAFIPLIGALIALLLFLALLAAQIVFPVLGGVRVNNGGAYRYPVAIRFIK